MKNFCETRPYACMENSIVTSHLANTFYHEFYLEIEKFYSQKGFENAEFEYCRSSKCLEEEVSVKNSSYLITRIFPRKADYTRAFGGVNGNLGVAFIRAPLELQSSTLCSVNARQGNQLSKKARKAIAKGETSIWNLRKKHYPKYELLFVETLPQIDALNRTNSLPPAECWIRKGTKRFIFEINETGKLST